ncbi:MAG: hypothetical protein KBB01_05005 [Candidatus Omnitrophica bacterium]|jgi:hypothetical protein|nr:hypothetical protein [Candidatus Omnitrophota bacterium]
MAKNIKLDILRELIGILGALIIGIFFWAFRNDVLFFTIIVLGYIIARIFSWIIMFLLKK